jgi:hypothetical protein
MILVVTLAAVLAQGGPRASPPERTVTKASVYLVQQGSFLAPRASAEPVYRGDKVRLEAEATGAWLQVSVRQGGRKVTGFIHASYVSDRPAAFKLEEKEVEGRSTVSGHYNLAVGGFREEVARKRQADQADLARGYQMVERYMPLKVEGAQARRLPPAARARLLPADGVALKRFLEQGSLRRAEAAQATAPEAEAAPAGGAR